MRRKVIKLAEKTYVVSLPSKWVRQFGIKKGDELTLSQKGSQLTLSTEGVCEANKCSVRVGNTSERALRWLLSSLHKKGYDEIELLDLEEGQSEIVSQLLKDLFIGFTTVYESPKRVVVRAIAKDNHDAFDTILRRAFLVTLELGEQLHERARNKIENINSLLSLEKLNNQLTNFCERSLNKKGEPLRANFLYVIVWNLEKIADDYKYLCKHLAEEKKVNASTLDILEKTNKLLRSYYELFYKFDVKKLTDLSEQFKKLENETKEEMKKTENTLALSHIHHILLKIADFSASIFALNTHKA